MTLRQFWLTKLAEECQEVAQRALKQMQFGAEQIQKGNEVKDGVAPPDKEAGLTNRERLDLEINDFLAVVDVLQDMDEVSIETAEHVNAHIDAKQERIQKYLKFSQELGMVGHE